MGLCHGKTTAAASPSCPDLPPEIVGEILSRLPFQADRLSFKAVCRGWRLAARQQAPLIPPALPCINVGGSSTYQSMSISADDDNGSKAHRRRFSTPRGFQARATFGGWILYEHKPSGRYFLRDPFSTSTPVMEIPDSYRQHVNFVDGARAWGNAWGYMSDEVFALEKIVVCSSDLVVMTLHWGVCNHPPVNFACFRPRSGTLLWSYVGGMGRYWNDDHDFKYRDIVFHFGKIFAVNSKEHLFSHRLVGEALSRPDHVIKERPGVATAPPSYYHLVPSSDKQKLFMVRWSIPSQTNNNKVDHQTINLQVFQADLDKSRWSEVKDLGGEVLFVGRTGSKALMLGGSPEHYYGHKFQGGNRVILIGRQWALARRLSGAAPCRCLDCQKLPNGIPSYCVYDMVTGKTSLVSLKGGDRSMKSSKAEWFFPSK